LRLEDVIPIKVWSMDRSFPCRRCNRYHHGPP
jgi:hypothetical protein